MNDENLTRAFPKMEDYLLIGCITLQNVWHMKKVLVIPIFAVLVLAVFLSAHQVYAVTPLSLSLAASDTIQVSNNVPLPPGSYAIFVNGVFSDSVTANISGFFTKDIGVPASSTSITYTIDIRANQFSIAPIDSFSGSILVPGTVSIPEFPFPFSLVIIFVAITAVYLGIRQKMTSFKRF
jgi:hypothetical protein